MKPWVGADEYFPKSSCFLSLMLQGYKPDIILCPTHVPASCVLVHKRWMQLFSPPRYRFSRDLVTEPGWVEVPRACFPCRVYFISGTTEPKTWYLPLCGSLMTCSKIFWPALVTAGLTLNVLRTRNAAPSFQKANEKPNPQKLCWA